MMDHYKILELQEDCSKDKIKKQYHKLSKIYHPDKNNGCDIHFKEIKESYDVLYDDEKRKKYNIQRIFKNVDFTEEEFELFINYYQKIIDSKEFLLMKKLYQSIPDSARKDIKEKIKKKFYANNNSKNKREIIKKERSIDINDLDKDEIIILYVSYEDFIKKSLKIIHIYSKCGIYYLYLRDFKNITIILNNKNCFLTLKLYVQGYIL